MEGIYLMKPNLREFQELTGISTADETALIEAGRVLIGRGVVELIALSLGPRGALLITVDRALRADGLSIKAASVVGAGDSFLGALVSGLAHGDDLDVSLRFSVAAGAAAPAPSGNRPLPGRGCPEACTSGGHSGGGG
jgi:6-phosphofructokinase 2